MNATFCTLTARSLEETTFLLENFAVEFEYTLFDNTT
jgi:hypothetical protein